MCSNVVAVHRIDATVLFMATIPCKDGSNVVEVHRTDATYKDLPASQGSQSALDKCNRKLKEEYAGYKGYKAVKVH